MEGLHQLLEAVANGITGAAALIDVAGFTKAFSPITSELAEAAHTKFILDIVLVAVSVALVGVFEAAVGCCRLDRRHTVMRATSTDCARSPSSLLSKPLKRPKMRSPSLRRIRGTLSRPSSTLMYVQLHLPILG